MKDHHKGGLLDLDRRSRERVCARRAGQSDDWISLANRMHANAGRDSDIGRRPCWPPFGLYLSAFRSGRWPLMRATATCHRHLFQVPVRMSHFFAVSYLVPPASLLEEMAWIRDLGVRQVELPLEQEASEMQQVKVLSAIQNLLAENCRVAAVLRPSRGAQQEPEGWHQFCFWLLAQAGWQLERVQLGDELATLVRGQKNVTETSQLFSHVARLRQDYPGVALQAPGLARFDAYRLVQVLQQLLPAGNHWDGMTVLAPAWQALESVGGDDAFLQQLTLAAAVALRFGMATDRLQISFPPPPAGCDQAAEERIAGSVVRRAMLALSSGMAGRVAIGMDPAIRVSERRVLSNAIRELMTQLEGARFERRIWDGDATRDFVLEFSRIGKPPVLVGWTDGEPRQVSAPFRIGVACDYLSRPVPMIPHPRIRLTRNMAYFSGEK